MSRADLQIVRVRDAEIRVFNQDKGPGSDDTSDMYVMEVFGISLLIRLRRGNPEEPGEPASPYVHVDNENHGHGPLYLEVCNAGETEYGI